MEQTHQESYDKTDFKGAMGLVIGSAKWNRTIRKRNATFY